MTRWKMTRQDLIDELAEIAAEKLFEDYATFPALHTFLVETLRRGIEGYDRFCDEELVALYKEETGDDDVEIEK